MKGNFTFPPPRKRHGKGRVGDSYNLPYSSIFLGISSEPFLLWQAVLIIPPRLNYGITGKGL